MATALRFLGPSRVPRSVVKNLSRTYLSSFPRNEPFYGAPRSNPHSSSHVNQADSTLGRIALALESAATALHNPERADAVATLGEVTGHVALTHMYDEMMSDPTGQRILRDRPYVTKDSLPPQVNLQQTLTTQPPADQKEETSPLTFGQAYLQFLEMHGFDPDERTPVRYIEDTELAYCMTRYRQCHDYFHVLTGLPPTVLGELGLKWLELLQTGLPVAALSATVGSLRLNSEERDILIHQYLPWAVQTSRSSVYLLNVYYEEEFDTNLDGLRRRLGMDPAPVVAV